MAGKTTGELVFINGFAWYDVTNSTWSSNRIATESQVLEAGGDPKKIDWNEVRTA